MRGELCDAVESIDADGLRFVVKKEYGDFSPAPHNFGRVHYRNVNSIYRIQLYQIYMIPRRCFLGGDAIPLCKHFVSLSHVQSVNVT